MFDSAAGFVRARRRQSIAALSHSALSLFSGAGISDFGYEMAGFRFQVQCEKDAHRAALGKCNFPDATWIVDKVETASHRIVDSFRERTEGCPALLSITPPCQGMSSSNPSRGKIAYPQDSDKRNTLLLESLPIIDALQPRIVVVENVAPLLNRRVSWQDSDVTVVEAFASGMRRYQLYAGVIEMADYGIPQMRKRSIIVAIHHGEPILQRLESKGLLPWPRPTHSQKPTRARQSWITIRKWFEQMRYPDLDAQKKPVSDRWPLHFVPEYPEGDRRYTLVSCIPPHSGRSAFENDVCIQCGAMGIPRHLAYCPNCDGVLFSRPVVREKDGKWRLVRGFASSYRRVASDRPAPTITTNSSHVGSDNKIHPWQNRVLSTLECADLQTVPRIFDWSWALETNHRYVVRNAIGEALPPYFTYLHGQILKQLLSGILPTERMSRSDVDGQVRHFARTAA